MAQSRSIFFDEWKRCLREHYLHVVRTDDHITEPTLRTVLVETGFSHQEIEALYQLALCQQIQGQESEDCYQRYDYYLAYGKYPEEENEFLETDEPVLEEESPQPPEEIWAAFEEPASQDEAITDESELLPLEPDLTVSAEAALPEPLQEELPPPMPEAEPSPPLPKEPPPKKQLSLF